MLLAVSTPSQDWTRPPTPAGDDLAFAGVARLSELLGAGAVTPRELVELYLERIERLDPQLNAFVSVRADEALAEADAALGRLRAGESGPLLGVPVAVKDNVTITGEVTGYGTSANATPATADAEVVRRLRAAGAPILGRTAQPELEIWGHLTESQTHGATRNPWSPARTTGGSSGGTAAAVAAGLAPVGLASDGGASIRVPAAFCGLFGLKPTRGRISTMPQPERWHGLTVLGGIARHVLDAALFDDALRGPAIGDRFTPPAPQMSFAEAAQRDPAHLRVAVSLKGTIPGVKVGAAARRAVEQTAALLDSLGHRVAWRDPNYGVLLADLLPPYLVGVADDAARLEHSERLERRSRRMAAVGRRLHGRILRRALSRESKVAERVNAIFADHDVLLTPVTAAQPEPVGRWRNAGAARTFNGTSAYVTYTAIWNYLGQPAAALPAGFDEHGLPQAVQIVAPAGEETTLLSLAAQLERAQPWTDRRPTVS
ncbi:MAG TPA: amidase [Solirubrobacteraceae bacterium]|jgi:amidase|nr:amidase [Solirubrobacteraceae bacterium]